MPEAQKGRSFLSVLVAIFKLILILTLALACLGAGTILCAYLYLTHDLPTVAELRDYQPKHCPQLSSINFDNARVSTLHPGLTTDLGDIPPHVVNAFLAENDLQFLKRPPIEYGDYIGTILRRLLFSDYFNTGFNNNIKRVIIIEFLPPPYRRLSYKIKTLILSIRLTKAWGKKKILYVFLNKVYLGNGCFGVDAAARFYFGKTVQQLTIAEASQIAALVARPSKYDPFKNLDRAQQRKILVLERMRRVEFITEEQYEEALKEKLVFKKAGQKTP